MSDKPLAGKRLCIDPGHPSENGIGASAGKLTEVGIAWRVAVLLHDRIEGAGGKVVVTKHSEREYVTNRRRAEIANNFHVDLMVRLHCDDAPSVSGIAAYYPDREGLAADGFRGPSPAVLKASAKLAVPFHAGLMQSLKGVLPDRGLMTDRQTAIGGKQGALTGSIRSTVPVVLVEMVVLNSAHDVAFVTSKDGERRLSEALFAGIVRALA